MGRSLRQSSLTPFALSSLMLVAACGDDPSFDSSQQAKHIEGLTGEPLIAPPEIRINPSPSLTSFAPTVKNGQFDVNEVVIDSLANEDNHDTVLQFRSPDYERRVSHFIQAECPEFFSDKQPDVLIECLDTTLIVAFGYAAHIHEFINANPHEALGPDGVPLPINNLYAKAELANCTYDLSHIQISNFDELVESGLAVARDCLDSVDVAQEYLGYFVTPEVQKQLERLIQEQTAAEVYDNLQAGLG